jgi:oxidase EvaA
VERIPLDAARGWVETPDAIREEHGRYFSVIAVSVAAGSREVLRWTQPLLLHDDVGIVGFLTRKSGGVLHFLVRASVEPGNRDVADMGPTVACSGTGGRLRQPGLPRFADLFLRPPAAWVRYSATQSEEGGRFCNFQNRYVILEAPESEAVEEHDDFVWMTLGQVLHFARHGYFNIEARNLLACLDFADGVADSPSAPASRGEGGAG